ncbi:MAG: hypothetical protein EON55_29215, partial [Alphaproteobacteria bacterium]
MEHAVEAARRPGDAWPGAGQAEPHSRAAAAHRLLDLPPVTDSSKSGRPKQWLSAEHQADTPEFRRFVEREFPAVTDLCTGPDRRQFLRLMAASLSMAGLAGCDDGPVHRS